MEKTSVFEDTQLCFTEIKQESRQQLMQQAITWKNRSKIWEYLCVAREEEREKAKNQWGRQKETEEIKYYLKNPPLTTLQTHPAPGWGQIM